jgi:hypothetical protein
MKSGTTAFFAERQARANFTAFNKLMHRKGGESPRSGDEMGTLDEKTTQRKESAHRHES